MSVSISIPEHSRTLKQTQGFALPRPFCLTQTAAASGELFALAFLAALLIRQFQQRT